MQHCIHFVDETTGELLKVRFLEFVPSVGDAVSLKDGRLWLVRSRTWHLKEGPSGGLRRVDLEVKPIP